MDGSKNDSAKKGGTNTKKVSELEEVGETEHTLKKWIDCLIESQSPR